ncbi:MAG: serine/threonine protein kinase [Myxococcales bacterium]|nr:serine/threonine protein kinase [Myxococcales bacterium]
MIERIGEYELHKHIGGGGMADVYAGFRPGELGPEVCAIKVMRPQHADFRALFLREGQVAMQLNHCHIVNVFHAGEHRGRLFLVMDLVDGISLDHFLSHVRTRQPSRPNLDEAAYIARCLLFAVLYVHTAAVGDINQRIVHRDVSPQNVMISSSGEVKLTDFGIARTLEGPGTGRIYGKLAYMAPEQYQGKPVQQSDLFAVGAILYELVTGQRLRPPGLSRAELHEVILRGTIPALPPEVPREIRETIMGLLDPDPTRRIQSAKDALVLLGEYKTPGHEFLGLAELYEGYVGKRRSWYTDLHRQAQEAAEATTKERPWTPPGPGTRGGAGSHPAAKGHAPPGQSPRRSKPRRGKAWAAVARAKAAKKAARAARDDAEAPMCGRSWAPAQGYEVAAEGQPKSDDAPAFDEVTTVPWGHRPDDPSPEVHS